MVEQTHTSGRWPGLFEPWRAVTSRLADWFAPASEAAAKEDNYEISIELPGVDLDDISLNLEDGLLTLKGEKRSSREQKGDTYYFSERQYGAFSRTFRLPPDSEEAGLTADIKDGVLSIVIPKRTDQSPPTKKIDVTRS